MRERRSGFARVQDNAPELKITIEDARTAVHITVHASALTAVASTDGRSILSSRRNNTLGR